MSPAPNRPPAPLRALRGTLVAGAIYDFVFAALFVAAPRVAAGPLELPLPDRFYLWLIATLLGIVGAVYLVAARRLARPDAAADPEARALVAIAVVGRFAGAVALAAGALSGPGLGGLWVVAAGDLAFSLAHFVTGRSLWR
ncbi:MAG: hypothetical protein AMXMBFR36_24530 [Acidobacteriota bacterium]